MQWAKWLKWRTTHRHMRGPSGLLTGISRSDDIEVYFWIDYCSALQNTREAPAQIVPYMAALPAYVAVCQIVAAYWTEGYPRRAWCQAELLMGYAFVTLGDKLFIVPRGFEHTENQAYFKKRLPMPNPSRAQLTNEADRPVVAALTETARRSAGLSRTGGSACGTVADCSIGSAGYWFGFNVLACGQCCGLLACARARNVQPGKKKGHGRLLMVIPAGPDAAPQPAEMVRGHSDGVQLL